MRLHRGPFTVEAVPAPMVATIAPDGQHGEDATIGRSGAKLAESNRRRALALTPKEMRGRKAAQMRAYRSNKEARTTQ
jgi:hypothetical protein